MGRKVEENLTLPIEFQSHGKVVGPQLTQSLVDEEERGTDWSGGRRGGDDGVFRPAGAALRHAAPVKWNK